jgi:hypothetical protein
VPILNQDKCFAQQPKRLGIIVPENLPLDWLREFYDGLSVQLKLGNEKTQEVFNHQKNQKDLLTEKELFFKELDRHAGAQSTYSLKPQLLESLSTLYYLFTHPKTTNERKHLIASRIAEDISQCSQGFTNRVNYIISRFNMPQNMDELIAQVRFNLVDRIASIIAAENPQGIHVHNRVIEVAQGAGFGVWSINTSDFYSHTGSNDLSDGRIIDQLKAGFANRFQLFALVNTLRDELESLMVSFGYQGKRGLENEYKMEEYEKFHDFLTLFIPISKEELLETDTISDIVININWQNVKSALLQQLWDKNFVTFSTEEATLLDDLLVGENRSLDSKTLNTLISHGYELVQCLEFVSHWRMEQKAALVSAYLNKSPDTQIEVLAILDNEAPQLTAQLKKEPSLQAIYFAIAIAEKDVAEVRAYVEHGQNINSALVLLLSPGYKSDTLFWLHEHQHLLQTMTAASMNNVIEEGKYQGKTIAETLMSTKKGRQLILENHTLQTLLAETTRTSQLANFFQQADTARKCMSRNEGFFKKSSPIATQLVQFVVHGNLKKAKALLRANPSIAEMLLKEKVTVIDYSRRKVKQKTAFQAALCTIDDELCAMLAEYMPESELVCQYHEIFPKGHEAYFQAQTPFDFSQLVEAISQSSDADVQKALSLKLPNQTELWRKLEQFRADFTIRSSHEVVFNPKHLITAFELYNSQFDKWDWSQRDLFWRQILGYVQRLLPANLAMDFAQGLYNRVYNQEKSARSFQFKHDVGSIFPLVFDSFSGLGYELAVLGGWLSRAWHGGGKRGCVIFKTYVENKQLSLENYAAKGFQQSLSNSVM